MSYYTDFILECDELTFDRLVEYWKYNEWEDICGEGLYAPERVWRANVPPTDECRYLMYFSINHAPCHDDIDSFLVGEKIGVDPKRYRLVSRGECEEGWVKSGDLESLQGYKTLEYDADGNLIDPGSGYQTYEYCTIAIEQSSLWEPYEIDYTRDVVTPAESKDTEILRQILCTMQEINEKMEMIVDRLEEKDD